MVACRLGDHTLVWIYALTRQTLVLVAFRVGEKIQYDGAAGKVIGNDKANALLSHEYRKGWSLNG